MSTQIKLIFLCLLLCGFILPLAAAFPGNSLHFEQGDYVNGTGISTSLTNVTIECWVKHDELPAGIRRYVTLKPESAVLRAESGGVLKFYIKQSNGVVAFTSATVITANEWLHVAGTYNGSTLKLYLNGIEVGSGNAPVGGLLTPSGEFDLSASGESMRGYIDDVRVWNTVRTQTQIKDNRFVEVSTGSSGLVNYWKLNESSGTTATDSKGTAHGTLTNMTNANWVASTVPVVSLEPGNALRFDGSNNNYVSLNKRNGLPIYNNGTSNAYSVSMWVKGDPQAPHCVYAESSTSQTDTYLAIQTQTGGAAQVSIINNGSTVLARYSQARVFDGTWHHLAWVDNNGTATLYVDGVPDGANFNYSRISLTLNTSTIGAQVGPSIWNYYTGYVDELCLWKTALSQAQVRQYMSGTNSASVTNLVSMYQFNETSGSIVYDVASGNNGTMNNMNDANREESGAPIGPSFSGNITSNTVWSGNSLIVNSDVTISNGVTLTIEPGLTVFFSGYYSVYVQGRVLAVGTEQDSIKFSSFANTPWHGFRFVNTPSSNAQSQFKYCSFTNASGGTADPDYYGSAMYIRGYDNVLIEHSSFRDNDNPGGGGGAIYLYDAVINILFSHFDNNSCSGSGAAIKVRGKSSIIEDCSFTNNISEGDGGAIHGIDTHADDDDLTIRRCVFYNNEASGYGGAVAFERTSDLYVAPSMENCLFTGNSAAYGGAISFRGSDNSSRMYNCTVLNNSATRGGGLYLDGSSFQTGNKLISSSVFWGNTATSGVSVRIGGVTQADFKNCDLEGDFAGISYASGASLTGDYIYNFSMDPLISYSVSNPGTGYVLASTSPLINGSSTTSSTGELDVHRNLRTAINFPLPGLEMALRRADIGAIEYQGYNLIFPSGTVLAQNYTFTMDAYLFPARSMTVNPGVTVSFAPSAHAIIYGNLTAIGSINSPVTFTESTSGSRWMGLTFISSSALPSASSRLEYCIVEKGNIGSGDDTDGGNIRAWYYPDLIVRNCTIRNGYSGWGGALYARNSTIKLISSLIFNNQATNSGGALYLNTTTAQITNCTIVENTAPSQGALRVTSASIQPQIRNCIIRNNGSTPISMVDGTFTNIKNTNIEGGYSGIGNIDTDPSFTGDANHPYSLKRWSYCINTGIADSTGLGLPTQDLMGNPRIYSHTNTFYDRVDMGAYEFQGLLAPGVISASDGNNDYPGYVRVEWDYNLSYNITLSGYRVFRNGALYETISNDTNIYSDYNADPGTIYAYYIQAYYSTETGNSPEDTGYVKPNGIISGNIKTTNNNPVMGVKVSINPSVGYCLHLNAANSSSISIPNPNANLNSNFTLELWVNTTSQNVTLFNSGTHTLSINSSGLVQYADGLNTLIQQDTSLSVTDADWHHIAIVNDFTNNQIAMYLDDQTVASDSGYIFGNYVSSAFVIPAGLTGYVDDLRIWEAARDSSEVANAMNIVVSYNSPGLKGYWAMNEGTGLQAYDATNNSINGSLNNCNWSSADPEIALGAITTALGDYVITQIPYGAATTFAVIPIKTGHMFQPEQRLVTLSNSNIAADNVDFTDNSMIPITGYVVFQGTTVPVESAVICLNGSPALPRIVTDDDGYYVLEVEHGTNCIISVDYNSHPFNRSWNLGTVTYPRSNVNFQDIFRTEFKLDVVGGPDSYAIGDFDVTLSSVCGRYTQEISGQDWSLGGIMVSNIPPLNYNVIVNPGDFDPFALVVDDQFQAMKTQALDIRNSDAILDTLRYEWRAPLEINVAWDDSLSLKHFADYPTSEFRVLTQNVWYSVIVTAFEDYSYVGHANQKTYLNDCTININDEVGTRGLQDEAFEGETEFEYVFAPYLPNIQSGYARQYQNMLEITVRDNASNRFATQSDWVLTQGVKPMESTYATTSPQIPLLILHDPPGDGSQVTFNQSHSHTTAMSTSIVTNQTLNASVTCHMGPDFSFSGGTPFFSKETNIDITSDFSDEWTVQMKQTNSKEKKFTLTTSTELATSSSGDIIGDFGADVFMGAAINLLWGVTKEVYWDYNIDELNEITGLMVTPEGFDTQYIFTQSQIENSVIPNLIAIGDTASVSMWQAFLDMNEENKSNAVDHPDYADNISFCAGPSYTMSSTSTKSASKTFEWEVEVSREFGMLIGSTVDGVGYETSFKFNAGITIGESETDETEDTTTTTILLEDDDVASDLTFGSDYFTVDIKKDPVYGTPVFNLISGASSNHWEPNTQPRDGVMMNANTYTASDIPDDQPAVFLLYLSNTSQTNEPRRYFLEVMHATNTLGATIKINGVAIANGMAFDLDAGQTASAVMTVEPGLFGYELEGLTLEFYAEGDRGYEGPDGHYFDVFKSFNIYWEAPYSRVSILYPQDNWILNQAMEDTLEITFKDYDLNKPDFKSIKLEYKHPSEVDWMPAFEILRSELEDHPRYIQIPWDVSALSDGLYQIRACTTDSIQANWYTNHLSGVIDRESPQVWGLPQPADGILQLGDLISLTFNENINPLSIMPDRVELLEVGGQLLVDCEVQCYDNAISIVPNISNYWMENKTFEVSVHDLYDLQGNPMETPVEWEFYVNANPVYWQNSKIELIKPLGQPYSFASTLINSGGQQSSFSLTDLPAWLTANPMTGTLLPLDTETISFSISSQLGFGTFRDTLYADIPGLGKEPLVLEVKVLADPPEWTSMVNFNYDHTMTIIGQMIIEDIASEDQNDIIGAFIQNASGEYECRGVANTQYVDYLEGTYQFFLTVHSDVEYSEDVVLRVWDASSCKDYFGVEEEYIFASGANYGSPVTPEAIHPEGNLIKELPLPTGWSWISTNLLNSTSMNVNSVLASLSPTDNDLIKTQIPYAQYTSGTGWLGSLTDISNTAMYKIKLAEADQLVLTGDLRDPDSSVLDYGAGWNWIGYIPHVSISVGEALGNAINLSTGDMIKSQRAFAQYLSGYGWLGSLRFMNPGEGYLLKTAQAGSFTYPDYQIPRGYRHHRDPELLPEIPGWDLNPLAYEFSANITAIVQSGGITIPDEFYIGAFVGNECRGIAAAIQAMGSTMYFLTVYANAFNETLTFKVYNPLTETVIDLPNSLAFVNNQITGSPLNPYAFLMPVQTLGIPQNLSLIGMAGGIKLSWDPVTGAQYYRIYVSNDPNAPFEAWTLTNTVFGITQWLDQNATTKKFYRVTAGAVIGRDDPSVVKPQPGKEPTQVFEIEPDNSKLIPHTKP